MVVGWMWNRTKKKFKGIFRNSEVLKHLNFLDSILEFYLHRTPDLKAEFKILYKHLYKESIEKVNYPGLDNIFHYKINDKGHPFEIK